MVIFHSYVSLREGMRRSIFSVYVRQCGGSPEVAQRIFFVAALGRIFLVWQRPRQVIRKFHGVTLW